MGRGPSIRRAKASDAEAARELIGRSMAVWDKPAGHVEEAIGLMSLSADDLERDEAWVLADGDDIVGFIRISFSHVGSQAEIEELHLDPAWIGRGQGRRLFEHGVERARDRGAPRLVWSTDSYALGFYLTMGGVITGSEASGIAGDEPLTTMELLL
jgi:GNAT superfamily N-acetyltransferase